MNDELTCSFTVDPLDVSAAPLWWKHTSPLHLLCVNQCLTLWEEEGGEGGEESVSWG